MAAAFVRESTFSSSSFITPTTVGLSGVPAANNTLVYTHYSATTTTTITSITGCGAVWTKVARVVSALGVVEAWVGAGCDGSGSALTVNTSTTSAFVANITEFSGLIGTFNTPATATASSTAVSSGTVVPAVGDLVVSMVGDQVGTTLTPTDTPTAFTALTTVTPNSSYRNTSAYLIATSTSPAARSWTRSPSGSWAAITVALPAGTPPATGDLRVVGAYAEVATSNPSAMAVDGAYAEVVARGGTSALAVDAGYLEVLSVVAPPPPYTGETPATITTDKTLWLRASDLSGADGSAQTAWTDQSGKGNNVSGMSGATLEGSASPKNGKALRMAGGIINLATPTTLGLVAAGVHQAAELWVLAQLVTENGGAWRFGSSALQNHFTYGGLVYNDFGNATRRSYTPTLALTSWRLIRLAVTASGVVVDHIDNVQQQRVTGVTKAWGSSAVLSDSWNGRFVEALLIPGGTTFAQKQKLTDYYNGTYNLSIAAPTATADDVPEPVVLTTMGFWGMLLEGGPPAPLPGTLAGVALWLRGKDNAGAGGTNIDPWVDQSGNGRNATAVNNFPSVAAAATPNGGKAVQFGNTGRFAISGPFAGAPAGQNAEVWIVVKSESTSTLNGLWGLNAGSASNAHSFFPYDDGRIVESFGINNATASLGSPNVQKWCLYRVTTDGTSMKAYLDGTLLGTTLVASSGGASWATTSLIGATRWSSTIQSYFTGKIAEVLMRDRISNAGETASLITYFNTEHGLSVPGGS